MDSAEERRAREKRQMEYNDRFDAARIRLAESRAQAWHSFATATIFVSLLVIVAMLLGMLALFVLTFRWLLG